MNIASRTSLLTGIQTLRANPLRTVLSTLGVIIGVAALVAILALGDGLERFTREQIETTTDFQNVMVLPQIIDRQDGVMVRRTNVRAITPEDARDLSARIEGLGTASLRIAGSAYLTLPVDTARRAALVEATMPGSFPGEPALVAGRWPVDADGDGVIVLSHRLARALAGEAGPASLVGRRVSLGDREVEVLGVLEAPAEEERTSRAWAPLSPWISDQLAGLAGRTPALVAQVYQVEDVPRVEQEIDVWLRERFGSANDFIVSSSRERADQVSRGILVFKLALGSITGISILVGGIGIMNILLASVHERTREIGIRRAAGARRRDIFLQFLAESVTISALGALIGVITGLLGAFGVTALIRAVADAPVHAAFAWSTAAVAALVAVFVGIAFGTYPARHAARISPIEAIRHE